MHLAVVFLVAVVLRVANGFNIRELEEFDEWGRSLNAQAPHVSPTTPDICKKDILVVLDVSYSVDQGDFNNKLKPFLKKFVSYSDLNVGPSGTHIAMILFSSTRKTRIQLKFGDKTSRQELVQHMSDLNYDDIKGDQTRTGLAMELADQQIFTRDSPLNHRSTIPDVVLLITDGEPIGKWTTNKVTGEDLNEEDNAYAYADHLKKKDVLIVGIAVRRNRTDFKDKIQKMASSVNETFDVEFDGLDNIMAKLVDASCKPFRPGDCHCPAVVSNTFYVQPGKPTTQVAWQEPGLQCKNGLKPQVKTAKSPDVTSPANFGVGKHAITYTYTFPSGFDIKCFVNFTVGSCTCPSPNSAVVAYLSPGSDKTSVSWTVPQPTCKGSLKSTSPNVSPGHQFKLGSHTVTYTYSTIAGHDVTCSVDIVVKNCQCPPSIKKLIYVAPDKLSKSVTWTVPSPNCPGPQVTQTSVTPNVSPGHSFSIGQHSVVKYAFSTNVGIKLECRVNIEVRVIPCQGKDYNPFTKVCCCGKLWHKKSGWKCCGKKYHDGQMKCCTPNYNLVAANGRCPGDDVILS